ncbi:MAG: hypothetical protein KatS3mg111_2124 [Pirellulaceae bacterium]|nr:MAG: hypothetical protein KatS3mg111_2124 [Pirellulaceae bacterium]
MDHHTTWQRWGLAVATVGFLTFGLLASTTDWLESGSREFAAGTLLKVGVVLGIVWLAAPHLQRLGWQRIRGGLLVGLIIVLLLFAIRPRIGAVAAVVIASVALASSLLGWVRRHLLGKQ